MAKKKKKQDSVGKDIALFILKIPYYFAKGIYKLIKFTDKKVKQEKIKKRRSLMIPVYKNFKVIKINSGNYEKWEKKINTSDSKIGIILGARGTGKTAFGLKLLENSRAKYKKRCYAIGFDEKEMPNWITSIKQVEQLRNNSIVLIDEGGILFNSRKFMSSANKLLSDLILIARHKNLSIIFISQNSSNLEINVLRQADFLVLKPSSLLQKDFERKIIQKIYKKTQKDFERFKDVRGITNIYSDDFNGFVSNPLPSFWKTKISKAFR